MSIEPNRLTTSTQNLRRLLEKEVEDLGESLAGTFPLLEGLVITHGDLRMARVLERVQASSTRLAELFRLCREDLLPNIEREAQSVDTASRALAEVSRELMRIDPSKITPGDYCCRFLDAVMSLLPAEKGYLVHYRPATSEAEILAARNYASTHLAVEEYDFSRGLLREVFADRNSLVIENAHEDPRHCMKKSVVKWKIKAVLIVPLLLEQRPLGAVYLENRSLAGAFGEAEQTISEGLASLLSFYLVHSGWFTHLAGTERAVYLDELHGHGQLIGKDPAIRALRDQIGRIADTPAPVLIQGETGTGKELVARALHYESKRRKQRFVAVNCAAIPTDLLESELFGHEKGAFTGAVERRIGRIEEAEGGTFFLDEIQDLAFPLQAKLLRFLQDHEISRLGGNRAIRIQTRIVAASSTELLSLIEQGKFLDALYYRLEVIPLEVPPLRDRKSDIPLLMRHFVAKHAESYGKEILEIDRAVDTLLMEYRFPGNVRELENIVQRMIAFCPGKTMSRELLPREILKLADHRFVIPAVEPDDLRALNHMKGEAGVIFDKMEKDLIVRALIASRGNVTRAAERLGINRVSLHRKMRKHKVYPERDLQIE